MVELTGENRSRKDPPCRGHLLDSDRRDPLDFGPNDWYVEEKYQEFLTDPNSVDSIWRDFFEQTGSNSTDVAPAGDHDLGPGAPPAPPDAEDAHQVTDVDAEHPPGQTAILRGQAAAVVTNMVSSLEVPTATSVRAVPAKLMVDNRIVINNFLRRNRGGKISFTHLMGYAIVRAVVDFRS